jgi:hypothetical protein
MRVGDFSISSSRGVAFGPDIRHIFSQSMNRQGADGAREQRNVMKPKDNGRFGWKEKGCNSLPSSLGEKNFQKNARNRGGSEARKRLTWMKGSTDRSRRS